mmetsp:Transcript_63934/g.101381  ORF Transcript_63934/g.101381 Transcript_63934/m.101381 type:complete len:87 (-) Transcript_63934:240-500(-)
MKKLSMPKNIQLIRAKTIGEDSLYLIRYVSAHDNISINIVVIRNTYPPAGIIAALDFNEPPRRKKASRRYKPISPLCSSAGHWTLC